MMRKASLCPSTPSFTSHGILKLRQLTWGVYRSSWVERGRMCKDMIGCQGVNPRSSSTPYVSIHPCCISPRDRFTRSCFSLFCQIFISVTNMLKLTGYFATFRNIVARYVFHYFLSVFQFYTFFFQGIIVFSTLKNFSLCVLLTGDERYSDKFQKNSFILLN